MGCFDSEVFFDQEAIDNEILRCVISGEVLNDPHIDDCGHTFCLSCIEKLIQYSSRCPFSRRNLECSTPKPNLVVRSLLENLSVRCPSLSDSCNWTGKYLQLAAHESECEYVIVECQWDCGTKMIRKNQTAHTIECEMRTVECEHCLEEMEFCAYANHVNIYCDEKEVSCPYLCGKLMVRRLTPRHVAEDCQHKIAGCRYARYGCIFQAREKCISNHYRSCGSYHSMIQQAFFTGMNKKFEDSIHRVRERLSNNNDNPSSQLKIEKLSLFTLSQPKLASLTFDNSSLPKMVLVPTPYQITVEDCPERFMIFLSREVRPFERVNIMVGISGPTSEGFHVSFGFIRKSEVEKSKNKPFDEIDKSSYVLYKEKPMILEDKEGVQVQDSYPPTNFKSKDFISYYIDKANKKVVFENFVTGAKHEMELGCWDEYVPAVAVGMNTQIILKPTNYEFS
jgi:hypothetical protein